MGMYTKLFVACSFGFIILTIVSPVTSDVDTLESTTEGHSSRIHHHKGHHQHHHHHHHTNSNKKRNKKNHHHRKNRKIGHGSTKKGDHRDLLHSGNSLQPSFVSPETFQVETSMRPARNRREKDHVTTASNEKIFDKTSTTDFSTKATTKATTTTSSSPAVFARAVAITESGTKPVFGCSSTSDCKNITNSICEKEVCDCIGNLPVFISSAFECKGAVTLNATCDYEDQCLYAEEFSTCDQVTKRCVCIPGYEMKEYPDVGVNCVTKSGKSGGTQVDPAMIGVLAGLALMFVIICVVLRLFSKARFRENRSIFNTPNPRLMNASLFKDSKLLSPARGDRRGSRASMRGPPSRAPSITSVNKDGAGRSPNGSLSKGRRGSTLSTASATGSAAAAAPPTANTPSPTSVKKQPAETTVAIEAVD